MPIMTFPCPKCQTVLSFDYADYDIKEALEKKDVYHYEELGCGGCGKRLKTVPWIAVYDEETEEPVAFV